MTGARGRPPRSNRTRLPWIDFTWNPVVARGLDVQLAPETLNMPLHWRKPRLALVADPGELFHPAVADDFIAHVFAVMQSSAAHTFRIITTQHLRMRSLIGSVEFWDAVTDFGIEVMATPPSREQLWPDTGRRHRRLPNVRLSVACPHAQKSAPS